MRRGCLQDMKGGWTTSPGSNATVATVNPPTLVAVQPLLATQPAQPAQAQTVAVPAPVVIAATSSHQPSTSAAAAAAAAAVPSTSAQPKQDTSSKFRLLFFF